jgi:hypothetical protein
MPRFALAIPDEQESDAGTAGPGGLVRPHAALEEAVVEAQGVVQGVRLVIVEHADPVAQLGDVDAEHLIEEYAALPAVDLGFVTVSLTSAVGS